MKAPHSIELQRIASCMELIIQQQELFLNSCTQVYKRPNNASLRFDRLALQAVLRPKRRTRARAIRDTRRPRCKNEVRHTIHHEGNLARKKREPSHLPIKNKDKNQKPARIPEAENQTTVNGGRMDDIDDVVASLKAKPDLKSRSPQRGRETSRRQATTGTSKTSERQIADLKDFDFGKFLSLRRSSSLLAPNEIPEA